MTSLAPAEPCFVGRGKELAVLFERLDEAAAGRGKCLLVAGPPGIGKTRLLEQLERRAIERGTRVHRARCWEEGGAPALWPWMQIIRSLQTGAALPRAREPGASALDSAEGRFAVISSIADTLMSAASSTPRLILIDDLHAADPVSLLALELLASAISDASLLVLAAYRDTQVAADPAQAARFAELAREAQIIHLHGLGSEDLSRWFALRMETTPTAELVNSLLDRSGGNPLFVDGIFRSIESTRGGHGPEGMDLRQLALPAEIGSAVQHWIERLPETARALLQTASLIGIEFEVDLLAAIATPGEAELAASLSEGVKLGILTPDSLLAPKQRFGHALIHDALFRSVPEADRRTLDRRIVEELRTRRREDDEVSATRIAHQLFRSVEAETAELSIEYCLKAATVADRRHADGDAAKLLQQAVDTGRRFRVLDDARIATLLLDAGRLRFRAGQRAEARRTLREAFELSRARQDFTTAARAAIEFVGPTAPIDEHLEPRLLAREALDLLPDGPSVERAELLLSLADTYRYEYGSDPAEFVSAVSAATTVAKEGGHDHLRPRVLVRELQTLTWTEDVDIEETLIREASRHLAPGSDDPQQILARSLLVRSYLERARTAEAGDQIDEIERCAERGRRPFVAYIASLHRAMKALNAGELEGTLRAVEASHSLGRFLDPMAERMFATMSFFTNRELVRLAEESAVVEKLIGQHETVEIPNSIYVPLIGRWNLGRHSEAGEELRAHARTRFRSLSPDRTQGPVIVALLAEISAELRDPDIALHLEPWLARWSGLVSVVSDLAFHCYGAMSRFHGLVLTVLERFDHAETSFLDAIERNRLIRAPLWENHAACDLAAMLAARRGNGDEEHARALLSSVRVFCEPRGARFLMQKAVAVESMLDRRGKRTAPTTSLGATVASGESQVVAALERNGDFWVVQDGQKSARLRDSKGLRYLELLLRHPRRHFRVSDLVGLVHESGSREAPQASAHLPDGATARGLGDAGEILDAQAIHEIRARAAELHEEIREATSWNDLGRVERLREELGFIERELRSGSGFAAHRPRAADVEERMRKAVTNRLRDAIRRIGRELPKLGAHLDRHVRTGGSCGYFP